MKKLVTILLLLFPLNLYAANTATQVDILVNGLNDTSGNPLSNARVEAYEAGTMVGKNIWTTKNKTSVLGNGSSYFTLDSYGKRLCYGDGWYKLIIKNSSGTTLYTLDNIFIGNRDPQTYDVLDYADLPSAITAIGSNYSTLIIPSSTTVGTNTTIPQNIALEIMKAGRFVKASGATLTINGDIRFHYSNAAGSMIFDGFTSTDITLNPQYIKSVHPEWWGFSTSESAANNLTYLTAAMNTGVTDIQLSSGSFPINAVTVDKRVNIKGITGDDLSGDTKETILTYSGTSYALTLTGTISATLENFKIEMSDNQGNGIDVAGNLDELVIDNLWIESTGAAPLGRGIRFNTQGSLGDQEHAIIRNCTFENNYYGILMNTLSGTSKLIKPVIDSNRFISCDYGYYDAGGVAVHTTFSNNYVESLTYQGVFMGSGTGFYASGNRFNISGGWDSFNNTVSTKNPFFFGTNTTQIYVIGNTFGSSDSDPSGKLFRCNGTDYLFIDSHDGIKTDSTQNITGNLTIQGVGVGSNTVNIKQLASQTGDLLRFQNSNGTNTGGFNSYGSYYHEWKQMTLVGTNGLSLDLTSGNRWWYDLDNMGTYCASFGSVTVSGNPTEGQDLYIIFKQHNSSNGNPRKASFPTNFSFGTNTYNMNTTVANRYDFLGFEYMTAWGTASATSQWFQKIDQYNMNE